MSSDYATLVRHGIAGQISVKVTEDLSFVGSTYGQPGPVVMVQNGHQVFVIEPSRFGDRFGREWVRSFLGERTS